jgi:hypothetical protein
MKIFKELKKLGYIHYSATTIEELDDLPLNSTERISEQALVLRWFREKYGYFQLFDFQVGDSKITKGFFFSIINIHNEDFFFPEDFENIIYKTYEEAELECLKKLIEIVRTKATSV